MTPSSHRGRTRVRALLVVLFLILGGGEGANGHGSHAQETQAPGWHHELTVEVWPSEGRLAAVDRLTVSGDRVEFSLHEALKIEGAGSSWQLEELDRESHAGRIGINEPGIGSGVGLRHYRAVRKEEGPLELRYAGTLTHAVSREGEEYARSFSSTPGIIVEAGIYLGGPARWIPAPMTTGGPRELFTYDLTIDLPAGWEAVSQGNRTAHDRSETGTRVTWKVSTPTEEAHLIAGRFTEYTRPAGGIEAQVFLRSEDPNLAAKYLEVTAQYVQMYSQLHGPYPYEKFALIENFWETGYGMPSFTLLGPQVIRFPFILHSSYPHEILHNWWGNSVYVDWERGNWCEGLTAYLADHLVKEGQGRGEEYRRDTLKKYRSYVAGGSEISLREFRSRHSGATEAVGYGKSLMLWHMLRRQIGDEQFTRALARVYRRHKFQVIGFDHIEKVFSETAGTDLSDMFTQWVDRKGAPELLLRVIEPSEEGANTSIVIEQVHEGDPFTLMVPITVLYEGAPGPQSFVLPMRPVGTEPPPRRLSVDLSGGQRPLWIAVDPQFDLFRRLDREEVPPSIGEIFGAERGLIVIPADGSIDGSIIRDAWDPDGGQFAIVRDDEIDAIPSDRPTWIFGVSNRFAPPAMEWAKSRGTTLGDDLRFGAGAAAETVPAAGHCFVVVDRHPTAPEHTVGFIGVDDRRALPGLARKLPHYGKYSYLAFSGTEPTNVIKGQWATDRSPLVWRAKDFDGPAPALPKRTHLARLAPVFDPARLTRVVDQFTDPAWDGRATGSPGAASASYWLAKEFAAIGLEPGGENGSWFQTWTEPGPDGPLTLRNVVGVLRGANEDWATQSVVVGAHYDHLGRGWPDVRAGQEGKIHPGADDNASGIAVMLDVARLLKETHAPSRSIVFVAFDGEEWGRKGSIRYCAGESPLPPKEATSMISVDAVGRLEGKKLLVLGSGTATEWIHIARGIGFTTGVESTAVSDDPGGSDHVSFHEIGVPGVQLTTGPHEDFHRPSDTADKIDAGGLVSVATWLREALVYLTEREDPLTSTLGSGRERPQPSGSGRRVSLGTVPDFTHPGPGVRVESVLDGSPAAKAGIEGGDRIVAIDGKEISDLRAFSEVLREKSVGDTISVEVERDGEPVTLQATLVAR